MSKVSCPRTQRNDRPGLEPGPLNLESSMLTTRPPLLPCADINIVYFSSTREEKWGILYSDNFYFCLDFLFHIFILLKELQKKK